MSENKEQSERSPQPSTQSNQPTAQAEPVAQVKSDQTKTPIGKPIWPSIQSIAESCEKSVKQTNLVRETAKESQPPAKPNPKSGD